MEQPATNSTYAPVEYLEKIDSDSFSDDEERNRALLAAYALIGRLETPWETVARICMNQPALGACLKIAKDLELFERWHELQDRAIGSASLASIVNCDPVFLSRVLRHLSANHVLQEVGPGIFKPAKFALALREPVFGEWINYLYDAMIPCFYKTPEYMAKTSYRDPVDSSDGIFQYTKNCEGKDLFQYYRENVREGASFNNVMGGVMAHQAGWLDIFPQDNIVAGSCTEGALVVDIGGNVGHDLERFRRAYPETAARLYLQDRVDVVQRSLCPDPIIKMAYDFFQPQPVKKARVYYMHGVLHDWPDKRAREILVALRDAMEPGYSKLLVHDHVLPEKGVHPHASAYDLTMMVKVAGRERSESDWKVLLASAGYSVVKIWRSPLAVQAIIEAEVQREGQE